MMRPKIGFKPVMIATDDRRKGGAKRAKWDGKPARNPQAGELYISGALPVAYRAPGALRNAYFIAQEVNE